MHGTCRSPAGVLPDSLSPMPMEAQPPLSQACLTKDLAAVHGENETQVLKPTALATSRLLPPDSTWPKRCSVNKAFMNPYDVMACHGSEAQ